MARVAKALLLASLTLWGMYPLFLRILIGQGTFTRIVVVSSVFLMAWHALLRFHIDSQGMQQPYWYQSAR